MTVDTNVISDILALSAFEQKLTHEDRLTDEEKSYFQRCRDSKKALFVMLDFDVRKIGLRIVYKELLVRPPLHLLYKNLFTEEAKITKECRRLAERYVELAKIPAPDASILALASLNNIDVLLSWNREHITNARTLAIITEINEKARIPTPEIITPRQFLDRIVRTDRKTFALSPSPLLPVFRVDSYLAKHGV